MRKNRDGKTDEGTRAENVKKTWKKRAKDGAVKIKILLMMVLLAAVIAGSQKAGEYLLGMADEETAETAAGVRGTLIVVDSGHGGSDPGKVGINGALEKDINLSIAKKLKKRLEAAGISVVMTREDDGGLADSKIEDMKTRVSVINEKKPVLAVSIHQNSYGQESIHGAQVFYYTHSKEGQQAAEVMQEALLAIDPENTRQAKSNDTYYMLRRTETPVIIVECGFLSNQAEADKLAGEEYQEKVADAVCDGVQKYIKGKQ